MWVTPVPNEVGVVLMAALHDGEDIGENPSDVSIDMAGIPGLPSTAFSGFAPEVLSVRKLLACALPPLRLQRYHARLIQSIPKEMFTGRGPAYCKCV
ncbi:unnamed protein product [Leptosia nina]|uniref:Uncharacterized protein n=1 Tax=Leptosia nina TaxID=320188 RepID=A0AAV1J8X9_9NEOP